MKEEFITNVLARMMVMLTQEQSQVYFLLSRCQKTM